MLWWAVTPFLIAFFMTPVLWIIAFAVTRRKGVRALYAALSAILICGLSFIPICILAYFVVSPFRFGEFSADNFDSVRFFRVREYLPSSATDITMVNTLQHHHARFKIANSDLEPWLDSLWSTHGNRSPLTRNEADFGEETEYDNDDFTFQKLGLKRGQAVLRYEGPYQGDWGGPTMWYDPESETAWQYVGYW